jgi:hypothetical protein
MWCSALFYVFLFAGCLLQNTLTAFMALTIPKTSPFGANIGLPLDPPVLGKLWMTIK